MSEITLSIVLPAYEEDESLVTLLPALQAVAAELAVPVEILVIDAEAPRDDTAGVCARVGVPCHPRVGGAAYGHAVRTGLRLARGTWIVVMDADGSHPPEFLSTLWGARHAADLVIASRYLPGGSSRNPRSLVWASRALNGVFQRSLGLGVTDVSNSLRLYRGDDVRALSLVSDHFDIVEEILVRLLTGRPGYRVVEVPFTFERRRAGKTKRRLGAFALGYLATLRRLRRLRRDAAAA